MGRVISDMNGHGHTDLGQRDKADHALSSCYGSITSLCGIL